MIAVCSNRPRPSLQNDHSKGNQWWARDVYHLSALNGKTLCGRNASDWLVIGEIDALDHNCCKRCASTEGKEG